MDPIDRIRRETKDDLHQQVMDSVNRRRLYADCFGTASGQKVLLDLMTRAYTFSSTFTGNSHSYFNEGARAFALEIMSIIPGIVGKVIQGHLGSIEADLEKQLLETEGE